MTKKDNKLKKWRNRVGWAINASRRRRRRWKRAVDLYEAHTNDSDDDSEHALRVPLIYSVFATMLPTLFSAMPKIKALPKTPEDIDKSNLVESVIKDIFEKTQIYQEIKRVVLSAIIKGTGFIKIGFKAEKISKNKTEEKILQTFMEKFPFGDDEALKKFKKDKSNLIDEIITEEGIWVKYVPNEHIYLDPEAKSLESCNFIVQKLLLSKNEFETRFKNTDIDKNNIERISTDNIDEKEKRSMGNYLKDPDSERIKVYEIWDKKESRLIVFAEGYNKLLKYEPWPHSEQKDYPFEVLTLAPRIDSIYGVELVLMLEDAARINNEMIDAQEDNAQRSCSGLLIEEGSLDDDEIENLEKPGSGKVVKTKNNDKIREFKTPAIMPETYQVSGEMRRIIEETAHVNAQIRQTSTPGKQTATEIRATMQAGDVLTYFKVREIERLIERIVGKVISLVKEYYDQPQLTKIRGKFGKPPVWKEWVGNDIGEYTFIVKAGSAAHQEDSLKLQQKMQYLQQVVQLLQFVPNPQVLIQSLLTEIGDLQGINPGIIEEAFQQPVFSGEIPLQGVKKQKEQKIGAGNVPPVPTPFVQTPNK